ncbi:hypothetical protein CDL12_19884 [Handroanthus impetiginosus]|uniref:Coiled-coil domain-containing protein SCD2-like n=1 Tax=Handroanthus impetiginosus TaxID=429701 RepID=A0A2G9GQL8_9LAMI|nr:hypothetical protein CDL12_19884 [Handroanthus impetiginosus]
MASPLHRHTRSGSVGISNMKKPQNTKAAAQRLAQMMAHQPADDKEEEDDLLYDFDHAGSTAGIGLAGGRQTRSRSPLSVRNSIEQTPSARPASGARASATVNSVEQSPLSVRTAAGARASGTVNLVEQSPLAVRTASHLRPSQSKPVEQPQSLQSSIASHSSQPLDSAEVEQPPSARLTSGARVSAAVNSMEQQPSSARAASLLRPSQSKPVETPPSIHSSVAGRSSQSIDSIEEAQSPTARSNAAGRSPSYVSSTEQPSSARFGSLGRPNLRVKTVPMVPPSVPLSIKPVASGIPPESQSDKNKDKRLSLDFGTFKYKEPSGQQSSSALQDELDMLQEENESLLEKLRIAEERCEEAESRTRQLEKQIASLGEGVSLEARLLSRKEADLQKREAALKVAAETYGGSGEEIAALRMEAEAARDEATSALEQLHDVEREVKLLRTMTQRMILTQDEMEEVVLKRCWLARCWSLCVHYGIHAEIARARYEYWSSLVSRPVEVILAAGQKVKDENSLINNDLEEREKALMAGEEVSKKPNVESVLLAEKGLREMTSLKVEEAIAISMAQKRRPSIIKSDELKLPIEGLNFPEAFELSQEECEILFWFQAWLMYFWRRAKNQGLEPDIAEERLQFWINQGNKPPTSHDAVDVERGLVELRKLGIETKLWEESRRLIDSDSSEKTLLETEYQMLA